MKRLLAIGAACVLALFSRSSAATVIAHGSEFSIDLSEATVCYVEPVALRRAEDCTGLDLSKAAVPPNTPKSTTMAFGIIRKPGSPTSPEFLGVVAVMRTPSGSSKPPDLAMAKETIDKAAREHTTQIPPGARVAPPTARLINAGDTPVVRGAVAVEGLPAGSPFELAAHTEQAYVFTADAAYAVMVIGSPKFAPALERFVDAAAASVRISPEARPRPKVDPGEALGHLVYHAYTMIAVGVIIAAALVASKRWKEREALARQQGMHQQPPSATGWPEPPPPSKKKKKKRRAKSPPTDDGSPPTAI